jgi:hypothetical protein
VLLHRFNALERAGRLGLTQEEREEMQQVAAEMERYELEYIKPTIIEKITDDYAQLRLVGDLGGVEL